VLYGKKLGETGSLADLQADYDAVFLGMGLQGVNALGAERRGRSGVEDAVDYIAELGRRRISRLFPWAAAWW
jgi:dihydropyrimidine dehydrogenase (NAD+) subunit PreT